MADVNVSLSFKGGEIVANGQPRPVTVHPGQTLSWKSDEGDVSVFLADAPLEGNRRFTARKGEHTDEAKIRSDAPSGRFECVASIGGKVAKAYGVEIVP